MVCLHKLQKGDTIIEVLFATAVAGLVIVIATAVMNRGLATTQMAVEHTLVRQGIDSQAEALRYLRDNKNTPGAGSTAAEWSKATSTADRIKPSASPFGSNSCAIAPRDFYINTTAGSINGMVQTNPSPVVSSEVFSTPGQGMWIEAVSPAGATYVDFHIRACWDPPFSAPKATLGTIVRLMK